MQPSDWQRTALSEITIPTTTWNPRLDPREHIRYVDVSAVDRSTLRIVETASHRRESAPSRARKIVHKGDTIFATVRPGLRRIAQVQEALDGEVVSTAFCVLRPDPTKIDNGFLFFAVQTESFVSEIVAVQTGASYPAVRDSDVLDQVIPLPPLDEQNAIASVLQTVRSCAIHEAKCEQNVVELKRVVMENVFTRGICGESQKESEIGSVPESWQVVVFGSVRKWLQYGTSVRCTEEVNGSPVLRIPNIEMGRVNPRDLKFARLSAVEAERYRLVEGDLIFIRTNGVIERLGSCAVYAGSPEKAMFASYLIRARLDLDRVDPHFLSYFFGSGRGTEIIASRATPAADGKYNLNTATIDGLPVPLPPTLDEQREIVEILCAVDKKIDLHRRKRLVLEDLFKSLLHKLMSGELAAGDLNVAALQTEATEEVAA